MASLVKIQERERIREGFLAWMEQEGVTTVHFTDFPELQERCGIECSRKQFRKAIGGLARSCEQRPREKRAIISRAPLLLLSRSNDEYDERPYALRLI